MLQSSSDFARCLQIIVKSVKDKVIESRKKEVKFNLGSGLSNLMRANKKTSHNNYEDQKIMFSRLQSFSTRKNVQTKTKDEKKSTQTIKKKSQHPYQSIYIIENGQCHIRPSVYGPEISEETKQVKTKELSMYLDFSQGSYFGTSTLFKQQSFEYYGDVYAGARD